MPRRSREQQEKTITYDSGVLIAVDSGDRRALERHQLRLDRDYMPVIPVVVVIQAWRGGPQHRLSRLLNECRIEGLLEPEARRAGEALAASGTKDVVDASVVVSALRRDDRVVTGDSGDLRRIAAALGRPLETEPPKCRRLRARRQRYGAPYRSADVTSLSGLRFFLPLPSARFG